MFEKGLPDGPLQKEIAALVTNQYRDPSIAIQDLKPIPQEFSTLIARALVQHSIEMTSINDIIAKVMSSTDYDFVFNQITQIHNGKGLVLYGKIGNGKVELDISYTSRIKDPVSLSNKIYSLHNELQNGGSIYDIRDSVAERWVIGMTDREQYKRPHNANFNPKSHILDEVLAFQTNDFKAEYLGSPEDVKIVKEYMKNFQMVAVQLWFLAMENYMSSKKKPTTELIKGINQNVKNKVLPHHSEQLAFSFDIWNALYGHFHNTTTFIRDYTLNPKPNGYSARHINFYLPSGFTDVERENHITTGIEKIVDSHDEIAGHGQHSNEKIKDLVPGLPSLVPNYSHDVEKILNERFNLLNN